MHESDALAYQHRFECAPFTRPDEHSSMIDQYAEDGCGQHRTEHDVDRFKCVAVPHQNCSNAATTVFELRTFTGSKFSVLRYGICS